MRRFWDERARENAAYFVDNRLDYRNTDIEAFWAEGPVALDECLAYVGAPEIPPEAVVVEIGCGIGRITRPLADRARAVKAFDVSDEMLRQAREANAHLANVDWILGDGASLAGVGDGEADVVFSHVVFQHIPDPAITLEYVRDMGRVLRPGGWAAFGISNDPSVHRPPHGVAALRLRVRALAGRAPRAQGHPAWVGSAVDLDALRSAAGDGGLEVERLAGEGTQYCWALLRRPAR